MRIEIDLDSEVRRKKKHMSCDFEGDKIILDPDSGLYFSLSPTGRRIWEHIGEERIVRDLVLSLQSEFEVDSSTCETDTLSFLNSLLEAGLIDVVQKA